MSEPFWHWWQSRREPDFSSDKVKLDSMVAVWKVQTEESKAMETITLSSERPVFFSFDPNNASVDELKKLGFSKSLVSRIAHYREKGGTFRTKLDLLKIYGLDSTFYRQVYPFINLPVRREKIDAKEKFVERAGGIAKPEIAKFDLNQADTSHLKKIYGIGEKLSLRIIKYREKLGGFVRLTQLNEVYGLDSTVVNRLCKASFLDKEFQPVKINLNTVMEKQLSEHPYLLKAAGAIVAYRFQHGEFKSLGDLRDINSIDEKTIQKVLPYLKVNED